MTIKNRKKHIGILLSLGFMLLFLQQVTIAEAGRSWVSNFDSAWDIQRVCRNGAEFLIVHTSSTSPDAVIEYPEIRFGLTPRHLNHEPESGLLDANGNLTVGNLPTDFYPAIGSPQSYFEDVVASSPVSVSLNGDPSHMQDYYLYISGNVRFYSDWAVGTWVLFNEEILAQVEDCHINNLSSVGDTKIDWAASSNTHIPADLLVYTLENAPDDGKFKLAASTLTDGSQFTADQLSTDDLIFAGEGGEPSAQISSQATFRISVDENSNQLNNASFEPSISASGTSVVFTTNGIISTTLDINGVSDIAFNDLQRNSVILVSLNEAGTSTANGASSQPDIAPTGNRFISNSNDVTFSSTASNLIDPTSSGTFGCIFGGDTNGVRDIFLWKKDFQMVRRSIFKFSSSECGQTETNSWSPAIAGNGSVVFHTFSKIPTTKVFDDNETADVMGYSQSTSLTDLFSEIFKGDFPFTGNGGSFSPDISADGSTVVYDTDASDLFPNDTNGVTDIILWREGEPLKVVSVSSSGQLGTGGGSFLPAVSRFGDQIAFQSRGSGLAALDPAGVNQIYVRDETAGCTMAVSVSQSGAPGNAGSSNPSISANGRFVAFQSDATDLVSADTNGQTDIFVFDRDADLDGDFYSNSATCSPGLSQMIRVSVASDGTQSNGHSTRPDISANGEFVAFASDANNLIANDTNGVTDVFVHYLGFTVDIQFSEPPPPTYRIYLPITVR